VGAAGRTEKTRRASPQRRGVSVKRRRPELIAPGLNRCLEIVASRSRHVLHAGLRWRRLRAASTRGRSAWRR
jgi:hypothetical protein